MNDMWDLSHPYYLLATSDALKFNNQSYQQILVPVSFIWYKLLFNNFIWKMYII